MEGLVVDPGTDAGKAAGQLSSSHGVSLARHRPGVRRPGWKADRAAQVGQSFRRIRENNKIRAIKVHHLSHAVGSLLKDLGVPLASARRPGIARARAGPPCDRRDSDRVRDDRQGAVRATAAKRTRGKGAPSISPARAGNNLRDGAQAQDATDRRRAAKHLPSALVADAVQLEDLKPQATRGDVCEWVTTRY